VIACSNVAGQFLPSVLIFKDVNKNSSSVMAYLQGYKCTWK